MIGFRIGGKIEIGEYRIWLWAGSAKPSKEWIEKCAKEWREEIEKEQSKGKA